LAVTVTEMHTIQWAERGDGNCWRWIWCHTPCKTSSVGNSCLQGTEVYDYQREIKVRL